ncbi:AraC family transcriptional regulator [Furfurilactobacillus milii]|uniref:AraC family transcriptional regulator n=1 Tax=Furfurilactobacillus milii TaxID=2888272 RepID=A0A6N9I408_9LACO|nr:AraC family transcriptional regulator [Furfurilactobacillus milii]MYV17527.1 AraC family transcriptional regulator [Furfurilactobacillus milii]
MQYSHFIPRHEAGISQKLLYFNVPSILSRHYMIYPLWAGDYIVKTPYQVKRDYMNSFILMCIDFGALDFFYHGKWFTALDKSVLILDCKEPNRYLARSETHFSFIHFRGYEVQSFFDRFLLNHSILVTNNDNLCNQVWEVVDQIKLHEKNKIDEAKLSEGLYRVLLSLLIYGEQGGQQIKPHTVKTVPAQIENVMLFIQDNFATNYSITEIGDIFGSSSSSLSHQFKKYFGMGIHEAFIRQRIIHAQEALTDSDKTIEEIAQECGFSDSPHFIKRFKQATGYTPRFFRQSHL